VFAQSLSVLTRQKSRPICVAKRASRSPFSPIPVWTSSVVMTCCTPQRDPMATTSLVPQSSWSTVPAPCAGRISPKTSAYAPAPKRCWLPPARSSSCSSVLHVAPSLTGRWQISIGKSKMLQRSVDHRVGSGHGGILLEMIRVILTIATSESSLANDAFATKGICSGTRGRILGRPNNASRNSGPMFSKKHSN